MDRYRNRAMQSAAANCEGPNAMTFRTLVDLLQERAVGAPTRVPVQFVGPDGSRVGADYGQLHRQAMSIAATLRQRTDRGDRALLMYPSGPEFIAAFFGCLAAGVIAVPTPPPLPGRMAERFHHIGADCTPRLLLTVEAWAALAPGGGLPMLATDTPAAAGGASEHVPLPTASPDDIAYLQYSSGTTGLPRGVMITHANVLAHCAMHLAVYELRSDDVNVGWMPHFHDFGLTILILAPMFDNRTNIVLDPLLFIGDPMRWLREMHERKNRWSSIPSFACEVLLRRIPPQARAELDLSAVRGIGVGAEPLIEELLAETARGLAPAGLADSALMPVYGLAEATCLVTSAPPGKGRRTLRVNRAALATGTLTPDPAGTALVSCGVPAPGMQVRIVDPSTRAELRPGYVGEILVAGANVSPGYWGQPDPGVTFDGTRYVPTHDLGAVVDGELYMLDRLSDRITVDGRDHYPFDVERTARRVDGQIRRAVAFGVERGLVLVVEIADRNVGEQTQDLADRVGDTVALVHGVAVERVHIVPKGAIPVTTSSKPRRAACRDNYLADIRSGLLTEVVLSD
jgi:acyl-CoA synthetase (AMP-forming)/AMP-acid ligase II